jgi:uncharacterized protein (UPF0335 family)
MADQRLVSIIDRIVALEEDRKELASDIKDVLAEAKSAGWNPRAIRLAVKRRMETAAQAKTREEAEQDRDLILAALGDLASTPLGQSAL